MLKEKENILAKQKGERGEKKYHSDWKKHILASSNAISVYWKIAGQPTKQTASKAIQQKCTKSYFKFINHIKLVKCL